MLGWFKKKDEDAVEEKSEADLPSAPDEQATEESSEQPAEESPQQYPELDFTSYDEISHPELFVETHFTDLVPPAKTEQAEEELVEEPQGQSDDQETEKTISQVIEEEVLETDDHADQDAPEEPTTEPIQQEDVVEDEPFELEESTSEPSIEIESTEDEGPTIEPTQQDEVVEDESLEIEESTSEPDTEIESTEDDAPEPEVSIAEPDVSQPVSQPKKKSLLTRLSEKLTRTRESFTYQLDTLFLGKKEIDTELLDDLEELLITADLGVETTMEVLDHARRKVKRDKLSDPTSLKDIIKDKIKSFIEDHQAPAELVMPEEGPFVIMVVGVNGVGKTTTIGKVAHKFKQSGRSVLLVAADTFRAAAISQLTIWGERNDIPVLSQQEGTDPSSVVFDALAHAKSKKYDVVLVDTAGRLHTQDNLMQELKKVKRVMNKQLKGAPHEVMLVIDATTGQNGISQAKLFNATVEITGITLTKLDGTAKGGIVANICKELQTPIRFIGVGEQLEDLRDFDSEEFVDALFEPDKKL